MADGAGMKQWEKPIPPQSQVRLTEAVERWLFLYEATGKKDEAATWQTELQKRKPSVKPEKNPQPSRAWTSGRRPPRRLGAAATPVQVPSGRTQGIIRVSRKKAQKTQKGKDQVA